jgi:ubiquinol-cytochrome c reductase iron-sulfur subunit
MSRAVGPGPGDLVVRSSSPPGRGPGNALVVVLAVVAVVGGALGFAVSLLADAGPGAQGLSLALAFAGLALAVRRVFAALYPELEVAEERKSHEGGSPPLELIRPTRRRHVLVGLLAGAGALLAVTLLAPITSLAARRRDIAQRTAWAEGVRLVDDEDRPLRPEHIPAGGMIRAWPADTAREELAAVALLRLEEREPETPTRLEWVVDETLLAYSQVCTHAGCPVQLYQPLRAQLFCPCHQASFDVQRGARPTFGPASRPLPQLPLGVDGDGYLVALGDFPDPVGPPVG